jgi:hypothetical protein
MRQTAFACSLVVVACTAPPAERTSSTASTAQAIVGGVPSDATEDSTVLLNDAGNASCSGTLITRNLLLTARHCVTSFNAYDDCGAPLGRDLDPSLLTVSVGAHATPREISARGTRLYLPPNTTALCGADLALLLLDREIDGATIAPIAFTPPSVGQKATAIGYGDGEGRLQRPGVEVLALGPTTSQYVTLQGKIFSMHLPQNDFATSESTCFGDSGGPLLDAEGQVIAVASRGLPDDPAECIDRPTYWTSLAPHEQLIRDAASDSGHPLLEGNTRAAAHSATTYGAKVGDEAPSGSTTGDPGPPRGARLGCSAAGPAERSGPWLVALALALAASRTRRRRAVP